MTEEQKKIKMKSNLITYENLTLDFLTKYKNDVIVVDYNQVQVYLKLSLKPEIKSLLAHSNGAYDPKKITLPLFQRGKWQERFNMNTVYISDPTLDGIKDRVAWGVGDKKNHSLKIISTIIKKISFLLSINDENVYYFGTSAGGFQSLLLGTMHTGSNVILNNGQFEISFERSFKFFKSKITGELTEDEFRDKYYRRFSFYEYLKTTDYFPRIFYFVNLLSKSDMNNQYKRFLEFISSNQECKGKVEILLYLSDNGHNGFYDKDKIIDFINNQVKFDLSNLIENNNNIKMKEFEVYDDNDEFISNHSFIEGTNSMYIPIKFFKKGYTASKTIQTTVDQGEVRLTIFSKYLPKKSNGQNVIYYEILHNNKLLAYEDVAHFNKKNFITIFNVKKDDLVTIRLRVEKNRSSFSWQGASKLSIVNYSEVKNSVESNDAISFTSPYMVKI